MDFKKMDFSQIELRCLAAQLPKDKVSSAIQRMPNGKLRCLLKVISFSLIYGNRKGDRE